MFEEIYILSRHGKFDSNYIETIPIHKRRYLLHLLNNEAEKMEKESNKISRRAKKSGY